jgi:hypothetical protein
MQIANYMFWLKSGPIGKGAQHYSLKFKVDAKCSDLKNLGDAMKSFPWATNLTHEIVLLRVPSCLNPQNINSTYHMVLIMIHINPTK